MQFNEIVEAAKEARATFEQRLTELTRAHEVATAADKAFVSAATQQITETAQKLQQAILSEDIDGANRLKDSSQYAPLKLAQAKERLARQSVELNAALLVEARKYRERLVQLVEEYRAFFRELEPLKTEFSRLEFNARSRHNDYSGATQRLDNAVIQAADTVRGELAQLMRHSGVNVAALPVVTELEPPKVEPAPEPEPALTLGVPEIGQPAFIYENGHQLAAAMPSANKRPQREEPRPRNQGVQHRG